MPNGLQWFEGELFVMDQLTDDIFVLNDYGNILRVINTQTDYLDKILKKNLKNQDPFVSFFVEYYQYGS